MNNVNNWLSVERATAALTDAVERAPLSDIVEPKQVITLVTDGRLKLYLRTQAFRTVGLRRLEKLPAMAEFDSRSIPPDPEFITISETEARERARSQAGPEPKPPKRSVKITRKNVYALTGQSSSEHQEFTRQARLAAAVSNTGSLTGAIKAALDSVGRMDDAIYGKHGSLTRTLRDEFDRDKNPYGVSWVNGLPDNALSFLELAKKNGALGLCDQIPPDMRDMIRGAFVDPAEAYRNMPDYQRDALGLPGAYSADELAEDSESDDYEERYHNWEIQYDQYRRDLEQKTKKILEQENTPPPLIQGRFPGVFEIRLEGAGLSHMLALHRRLAGHEIEDIDDAPDQPLCVMNVEDGRHFTIIDEPPLGQPPGGCDFVFSAAELREYIGSESSGSTVGTRVDRILEKHIDTEQPTDLTAGKMVERPDDLCDLGHNEITALTRSYVATRSRQLLAEGLSSARSRSEIISSELSGNWPLRKLKSETIRKSHL